MVLVQNSPKPLLNPSLQEYHYSEVVVSTVVVVVVLTVVAVAAGGSGLAL